jgi:hypothetical protein
LPRCCHDVATAGASAYSGATAGGAAGAFIGLMAPTASAMALASIAAIPVMADVTDNDGKLSSYSKIFLISGTIGNVARGVAQIYAGSGVTVSGTTATKTFNVPILGPMTVPASTFTATFTIDYSSASILSNIGAGGASFIPLF